MQYRINLFSFFYVYKFRTTEMIDLGYKIFGQCAQLYLSQYSFALASFLISLGFTCRMGFTLSAIVGVVFEGVENRVLVADTWPGVLNGEADAAVTAATAAGSNDCSLLEKYWFSLIVAKKDKMVARLKAFVMKSYQLIFQGWSFIRTLGNKTINSRP